MQTQGCRLVWQDEAQFCVGIAVVVDERFRGDMHVVVSLII